MKNKSLTKRIVSAILCLVMLFTAACITVFAADAGSENVLDLTFDSTKNGKTYAELCLANYGSGANVAKINVTNEDASGTVTVYGVVGEEEVEVGTINVTGKGEYTVNVDEYVKALKIANPEAKTGTLAFERGYLKSQIKNHLFDDKTVYTKGESPFTHVTSSTATVPLEVAQYNYVSSPYNLKFVGENDYWYIPLKEVLGKELTDADIGNTYMIDYWSYTSTKTAEGEPAKYIQNFVSTEASTEKTPVASLSQGGDQFFLLYAKANYKQFLYAFTATEAIVKAENAYLVFYAPYFTDFKTDNWVVTEAANDKITFDVCASSTHSSCSYCVNTDPYVCIEGAELSVEDAVSISLKVTLSKSVSAVKATVSYNGTAQDYVFADMTAAEDGTYEISYTMPEGAAFGDSITVEFFTQEDAKIGVFENGNITETYTTNVFSALKTIIESGDKNTAAAINAVSNELLIKTAELEAMLDKKMDASEVASELTNLKNSIEAAYEAADTALKGQLDTVSGEVETLKTALENAKTAINEAIAAIRKDLEDKTAALDAAVATKADNTEMLAKYNELKSAYETADALLEETDAALHEADLAMANAINELNKGVKDHGERLDSIETMNTVQLVAIIVVAVVAIVALILPVVKGKKKEENA